MIRNLSPLQRNEIELFTHTEITPTKIQIPYLDPTGYDDRAERIHSSKLPPAFFRIVLWQPKASYSHVEGHDSNRQVPRFLIDRTHSESSTTVCLDRQFLKELSRTALSMLRVIGMLLSRSFCILCLPWWQLIIKCHCNCYPLVRRDSQINKLCTISYGYVEYAPSIPAVLLFGSTWKIQWLLTIWLLFHGRR